MAVVLATAGIKSTGGSTSNDNISSNLRLFDFDYYPYYTYDIGWDYLPVQETRSYPVTHPRPVNVADGVSFRGDLYYHLIVHPSILNLGNLASAQTSEVELWNAYLEPISVTAILIQNGDGVSLSAPPGYKTAPFTLAPLQSIIYSVTASLDGPPVLDATVTWQSDHSDAALRVLGARVTLFPFLPDWNAGIDETVTARSSLLRSPDGSEQSISLRKRFRRGYGIPYSLGGTDAQFAENLIFGWQGRLYGVPAWPEQDYLTSAIGAAGTTLSTPTVGRTINPGSLIMVFKGKDVLNAEVKEVTSVAPGIVTVKTPFANAWPVGSRVVPVLLAAMAPQLQSIRLVPNYMQVAIQFDLQPQMTDDNAAVVAPALTYLGHELYLGRTNWRDNISVGMQTDVQIVDMQTGVFRLRPQSGFSNIGRSHEWFLRSMSEAADFRAWLKRRLGKTVGVWMPSAMDDFTLAADVLSTATELKVKTNGYVAMVKQHPARKDIYIRLENGGYSTRRITDSRDNGDGTTTLVIDASLGVNVAVSDVLQFSYLTFYRLASDDTTIHWYVPGKAEAVTGLIPTKALT